MALSPIMAEVYGSGTRPIPPRGRSLQARLHQRLVGGAEAVGSGLPLMPEGVDERRGADLVEALALFFGELQVGRLEVVRQLPVGAGADDDGGDAGAAEQPGEGDLRGRDVAAFGDLDEHVDGVVEPVRISHRRLVPALDVAASFGVFVPTVLAGEEAAGQRAPDQDRAVLVDG